MRLIWPLASLIADDVAVGIARVVDGADVRAGFAHHFAEGVGLVAGLHALGVGDLRELVQLVPGLGGGGVVREGGGGGAAQAVQSLPGGLVQRVGLRDGLAVGVIGQLRGLPDRALDGGHLVQAVDDAARDQGDGAGGVLDFLADTVARSVQGVVHAVAAVVGRSDQALGGVVAVAGLEAIGQCGGCELAGGRVAVGGDFTAAVLRDEAAAGVVAVAGDQAVGLRLAGDAARGVIAVAGLLAQRIFDRDAIARRCRSRTSTHRLWGRSWSLAGPGRCTSTARCGPGRWPCR